MTAGTSAAWGSDPAVELDALVAAYADEHGPAPHTEQLRAEALFGFAEVAPWLSPDARVLEIGAGAGLLAALVAPRVAALDALEPLGSGFANWNGMLDFAVSRSGGALRSLDLTAEALDESGRYDLIYSINVLEHVVDWRAALCNAWRALCPRGRALILCPNYDVPYEPHFGLPILGTKALTERAFRSRIARHEAERDGAGLWDSLNFIRASEVSAFARAEGMDLRFDRGIMRRMFDRVATDPEFLARRGRLAPLLLGAQAVGLGRALAAAGLRAQPYLRIELHRP